MDGVFAELTPGRLEFHAAPPPSDAAVAQLLATIRHRVERLLARRGLEPGAAEPGPPDGLAEASPVLAQILSASAPRSKGGWRSAGTRAPGSGAWVGSRPSPPAAHVAGGTDGTLEARAELIAENIGRSRGVRPR